MKKYFQFRHHKLLSLQGMLSLILAVSAASCTTEALDEPADDGQVTVDEGKQKADADSYYLTLKVVAPNQTGTRADGTTTDTDGGSGVTVAGTTPETTIKNAKIYMCKGSVVVADFVADYIEVDQNSSNINTLRVELTDKLGDLEELVGETVNIIVAANYENDGTRLYTAPGGKGTDLATSEMSFTTGATAPLGDFGSNGKVLPLVSYDKFEVTIPSATTGQTKKEVLIGLFDRFTGTIAWWDVENNSQETQLKLERGVARLEYKDKRPAQTDAVTIQENKFKIANMSQVYLELETLTPFNINAKSYLFRHTAAGDNTSATGAAAIFGFERGSGTGYNWIANPDWSLASGAYSFNNRTLYNALSLASNGESYVLGTELSKIDVTTLNGRTPSDANGYHPWCYVSENTLYSTDLMKLGTYDNDGKLQDLVVAKNATGVAFKFKVLLPSGEAVTDKTPATSLPAEMSRSTETGKTDHLIITDQSNGKWVEPEVVTAADGNKYYYLTYIACLVHNRPVTANPDNDVFAPMYYGVVRNNTYQITVGSVEYIPLPQDPRTLYLKIDVNVLPWTVRYNDFTL